MAQGGAKSHPLAAVGAIWKGRQEEIKAGEPQDGCLVQPEELKKVAKWLQQTVTKFSASAAVSEGPSDGAVVAAGEEVVRAFTAAAEVLVCLTRGAGTCLLAEVRDIGSTLAGTLEELGAAVGTPSMALSAGKVLDRVKHLERMSSHNRAAIRRCLLRSLAQVLDAQRELQQSVRTGAGEQSDDPDDFMASDPEFEPGERELVEAIVAAVEVLLDVLKEASQQCVPQTPSGSGGGTVPLETLEASAVHADRVSQAVDGLAVHAVGGLDAPAFRTSLAELRAAAAGFQGWLKASGASLTAALDSVEAALIAVPSD